MRAWAVDPEKEMLEEARLRTPDEYKDKVHWVHATAEELDLPESSFHLLAIGEAFHRMDQRTVASRAMEWLVPGGTIAILGYRHVWNYSEGWKLAVNTVLDQYRDRDPRVEEIRNQTMTFEDVLRAVGFTEVNQREYVEQRTWTEDEIVGYLFSVSTFSRKRLDIKAAVFEKEIRLALGKSDNKGVYKEEAAFQCLTAKATEA